MGSESVSWNNKNVRYRPGKLYICTKKGVSEKEGIEQIRFFCKNAEFRGYYLPGIFEINLDPQLTLGVAYDMIGSHMFRFVELEREGYF